MTRLFLASLRLCAFALIGNLPAAVPAGPLMVATNGVVVAPTDFFRANSNAINAVVTGGGGGGTVDTNLFAAKTNAVIRGAGDSTYALTLYPKPGGWGALSTGGSGFYGDASGTSGFGIYGVSGSGRGVYGASDSGYGVWGYSGNGYGGYFTSSDGIAFKAEQTGQSFSADVWCGKFYRADNGVANDAPVLFVANANDTLANGGTYNMLAEFGDFSYTGSGNRVRIASMSSFFQQEIFSPYNARLVLNKNGYWTWFQQDSYGGSNIRARDSFAIEPGCTSGAGPGPMPSQFTAGGVFLPTVTVTNLTVNAIFTLAPQASCTTSSAGATIWNSNNAAIYVRKATGGDKLLITLP